MKRSLYSGACIALLFLHTAFSFPTQPSHGFGFHRRGTFGGVVFTKKELKDRMAGNLYQASPLGSKFLRSLASPTTISCIVFSGVVLHCCSELKKSWGESIATVKQSWGETNAIVKKSWGESTATVKERWGETNAIVKKRWGESTAT
jgi:hypothetical protein